MLRNGIRGSELLSLAHLDESESDSLPSGEKEGGDCAERMTSEHDESRIPAKGTCSQAGNLQPRRSALGVCEILLTRSKGVVCLEVISENGSEHHERPEQLGPEEDRETTLQCVRQLETLSEMRDRLR